MIINRFIFTAVPHLCLHHFDNCITAAMFIVMYKLISWRKIVSGLFVQPAKCSNSVFCKEIEWKLIACHLISSIWVIFEMDAEMIDADNIGESRDIDADDDENVLRWVNLVLVRRFFVSSSFYLSHSLAGVMICIASDEWQAVSMYCNTRMSAAYCQQWQCAMHRVITGCDYVPSRSSR